MSSRIIGVLEYWSKASRPLSRLIVVIRKNEKYTAVAEYSSTNDHSNQPAL